MVSVPSPFGGSGDDTFDGYDEFVPASVPAPGDFLAAHDVLDGRRHLAVHRLARELFEERGVYDMTFGYNLARLNCDRRHPEAGYRYAVERPGSVEGDHAAPTGADGGPDDPTETGRVLRAEFSPTTPFCPQSDTLTKGSFRAWNGLTDRHEFDLVRVRVAPTHQRSAAINGELERLESEFHETGEIPDGRGRSDGREAGDGRETGEGAVGDAGRGDSPVGGGRNAPF